VQLHSCQTLTPETATSTHYFFQQSHFVDPQPPQGTALDHKATSAITASIFHSLIGAFNEDRDMISAQYETICLNPDAPMLPLAMDSALTQFRRLLQARLAPEAGIKLAEPRLPA
jgi:Vanillate O-demethylase oxygenase C-terminal domain